MNPDYYPISQVRDTYILRVWKENTAGENWRGQVQHARTGEKIAFQDIEELFEFLRSQLDEAGEDALPPMIRGLR